MLPDNILALVWPHKQELLKEEGGHLWGICVIDQSSYVGNIKRALLGASRWKLLPRVICGGWVWTEK